MDRSEDFPAAGGAARRSLCGSGGKIDEFDFVESKEERRDFFFDTVDTVSFCQRVADGIGLV